MRNTGTIILAFAIIIAAGILWYVLNVIIGIILFVAGIYLFFRITRGKRKRNKTVEAEPPVNTKQTY